MGNREGRLNLVFGKRIKGECLWYKKKVLGREKGGVLLKKKGIPEKLKKEQGEKRKKRKRRENKNLSQEQYHFLIKEGRSCIAKSSHTEITSEAEVRSLTSASNK